jgi:hypothetical protein
MPAPGVSPLTSEVRALPPGAAAAHLAALRARFPGALPETSGALAPGVETPGGGRFTLRDARSGVGVAVALVGARPAAEGPTEAFLIAPRGHESGADRLLRRTPAGLEDHLVFREPPARAEVRYVLALDPLVAGLRLGMNSLELLDAGGAPRLHVAPPYLIDAGGQRVTAELSVEGCQVDHSLAPPWGRPTTDPGARRCELVVRWAGDAPRYPAILDPSWQVINGDMGGGVRTRATATPLVDGTILVTGGVGAPSQADKPGPLATAWLFHPETASWTSMVAPMKTARHGHTATRLLTGEVLVAGGIGLDGASLASTELYSPAMGAWLPRAALGVARAFHTATLLRASGKVQVTGGLSRAVGVADPLPAEGYLASVELYERQEDKWNGTAPMAYRRAFHTATSLSDDGHDDRVFLTGGYGGNRDQTNLGVLISAEIFDDKPSSPPAKWQTFDQPSNKPSAGRMLHTATLLKDGRVLLVGGCTTPGNAPYRCNASGALTSTELFDPTKSQSSNYWFVPDHLTYPRWGHGAVRLLTGEVLTIGGQGVDSNFNQAAVWTRTERFRPPHVGDPGDHGQWTSTDSEKISEQRLLPAVAITDLGDVIAAGGENNFNGLSGTVDWLAFTHKGQTCSSSAQCATGFCVDGVCCDTACDQACVSCVNSLTGQPDGQCAPSLPDSNPHASDPSPGSHCTDQRDSCGTLPLCDGQGACRSYVGSNASCKDPTCTNGATSTYSCEFTGQAGCKASLQLCPGGFACDPAAPPACKPGPCQTQDDCAKGLACLGGACVGNGELGEPCSDNLQCKSNHCADGVCCDGDCTGECMACSNATKKDKSNPGKCGQAAEGIQQHCSDICDGPQLGVEHRSCDASGSCKANSYSYCAAGICNDATLQCSEPCNQDSECGKDTSKVFCDKGQCRLLNQTPLGDFCDDTRACKNGVCVEGVCCNDACGDSCQSCLAANTGKDNGTCAPIQAGKNPKGECGKQNPDDVCKSTTVCNGSLTTCPFVGAERQAGSRCVSGSSDSKIPLYCQNGVAQDGAQVGCGAAHCRLDPNTGESDCIKICSQHTDCLDTASCNPKTHTCQFDDFCVKLDGADAVQGPKGNIVPCATGHRCLDGSAQSCAGLCASSADCTDGLVCHADGQCRAPIGTGTVDADCACSAPGRPVSSWWPLLAPLAALGLARRRQRRR